jgi:hypothetical protein
VEAGWSDIDVLFVRRELPPRWMERRIGALTIKSAARVSAYLEAEITAGLLPPRVINALRLVAQDGYSVIVRASAWDQPDFGLEVGARASLRDLLPTARLTSITRITTVLASGWQHRLATERYRSTEGSRSQTAEWARSAWFRYRSLTVRRSSSYDRSRCHWLPSTNALRSAVPAHFRYRCL